MQRRRIAQVRWRRAVLLGSMVAGFAGCGAEVDREQARLCRLAAIALTAGQGPWRVVGQRTVAVAEVGAPDGFPVAARGTGVAVTMEAGTPGAAHTTACAFSAGAGPNRLVAVRTDAGALPLPGVVALDRFWVATPDAASLDPMPVSGTGGEFTLPPGTGYALQQVVNALPSAAVYALLAVAYALVYGLVGRINLAFGAFAAVGGNATALAVLLAGPWGAVALAFAVAAAAVVPAAAHGLAAARMVFRPLRRATGQQVLVATIGLALAMGEYLRLAQGSQTRWLAPILDKPWALAREGAFVVTITPLAMAVSAAAVVSSLVLTLGMRRSRFGRNWRAFRDDAGCAALFGVDRDRILAQTFAVAAAFAGIAGAITVLIFGDISFAFAQVLGLKALTAAVLGGIGSVEGALLGGLLIAGAEATWCACFPIAHRDLVILVLLVVTLVFRPRGLLGDRDLLPRRA